MGRKKPKAFSGKADNYFRNSEKLKRGTGAITESRDEQLKCHIFETDGFSVDLQQDFGGPQRREQPHLGKNIRQLATERIFP
ncbi:MAG: hypothetical protein A2521_07995 [Deltaproteobacteria bacterium RIFOXYD12_FULL_57_12]|nr:MAG: hypothetical protein A2521_07995 [Deltaproteobacteria bacterium RIFOXYD12_FULL_57_12]